MFKSSGKGKTKKPAGGYGSHGEPKQPEVSKPTVTAREIYSEKSISGSVYMPEALDVKCPKTQVKGRVTNRNGKAP